MQKKVGKLTLGKDTLKDLADAAIDKVAAGNLPPASVWTGICESDPCSG